jgi:Trypsin-co-occurring domain 1
MVIESKIDGNTRIYIDTEALGGFDKDASRTGGNPDEVIDNVVHISSTVARKLADAALLNASVAPAPAHLEVEFSLKVDDQGFVFVSRSFQEGQFKVRLTWQQ